LARKLKKTFSKYKFTYQTVRKDIDKLFILNKQERKKVEDHYDKDTKHSQDQQNQALWSKKIKEELNKFKGYRLLQGHNRINPIVAFCFPG